MNPTDAATWASLMGRSGNSSSDSSVTATTLFKIVTCTSTRSESAGDSPATPFTPLALPRRVKSSCVKSSCCRAAAELVLQGYRWVHCIRGRSQEGQTGLTEMVRLCKHDHACACMSNLLACLQTFSS